MIISKSLAEALTKVGFDYRVTFTPPANLNPEDFDVNLFHPGKSITKVQGWVRKTGEGWWVIRSREQYKDTTAWEKVKNNTYPSAAEALLALHAALYEIKYEIGELAFEVEGG